MSENVIMHPTLLAALGKALEETSMNQWREIAEQTRDYMVVHLNLPADADIIHSIRETHIAFGAACAYNAAQELDAAIERARELDAIFDLQFETQQRAIKLWQDANPGNDLTWPDGADLIAWLLDQVVKRP